MDTTSLLRWYQEYDLGQTMWFGAREARPQNVPLCKEPSTISQENHTTKDQQLKSLYQDMVNFKECGLAHTAENMVFSDGDIHSPLMLVGEAPGAEEDRLAKPFVGLSGQLLNNMLQAIHLDRSRVYIANIIPWRPPFNRQPSLEEIALCLPFIEKHIAIIKPKILICLGSVACKALLKSSAGITVLQKQSLEYRSSYLVDPIATFALYHPAYLLRSPGQKRVTWHQLLMIQKKLKEKCPELM